MERRVRAYRDYFVKFINSLDEQQARKIFYVIDMLKTQGRLSDKFVKHLEDGIYELRAEVTEWIPEEDTENPKKRN